MRVEFKPIKPDVDAAIDAACETGRVVRRIVLTCAEFDAFVREHVCGVSHKHLWETSRRGLYRGTEIHSEAHKR
jgi:hypothetical protein